MRRLTLHSIAFKDNLTRPWFKQTDQRLQKSGLTHAIATNEADHFPCKDPQINISKDVTLAVIGIEAPNLQHCH